jgi:DNA-binding response OmpR family regulator
VSRRVLVVDDEPGIRMVLMAHLRRRGWDVDQAASGEAAVILLAEQDYDAVVLDQRMPGLSGLDVVRRTGCDPPTFLFSAYLDPDLEAEAQALGCVSVNKTDIEGLLDQLDQLTDSPTST